MSMKYGQEALIRYRILIQIKPIGKIIFRLNTLQKRKKPLLSGEKMCDPIYMTERGMDDDCEKDRVCH